MEKDDLKMRTAVQALTFIIIVNLTMWMYVQVDVEPVSTMAPGISVENILTTFNATRITKTWTSGHDIPYVGDIVAGTLFLINAIAAIVKVGALITGGFPLMLISMGTPLAFATVFSVIWAMVWFWAIIEMISGRDTGI